MEAVSWTCANRGEGSIPALPIWWFTVLGVALATVRLISFPKACPSWGAPPASRWKCWPMGTIKPLPQRLLLMMMCLRESSWPKTGSSPSALNSGLGWLPKRLRPPRPIPPTSFTRTVTSPPVTSISACAAAALTRTAMAFSMTSRQFSTQTGVHGGNGTKLGILAAQACPRPINSTGRAPPPTVP